MVNREIDKLIHTKIMNLNGIASRYTEDIEKAWQVVEKLKELWEDEFYLEYDHGEWTCSDISGYMRGEFSKDENAIEVKVDNAPLAICLAALKAIGVEIK